MKMEISKIENKTVNNLRYLSLSMIEKANSGHPGIALSAAPILYTLYAKNMNLKIDAKILYLTLIKVFTSDGIIRR